MMPKKKAVRYDEPSDWDKEEPSDEEPILDEIAVVTSEEATLEDNLAKWFPKRDPRRYPERRADRLEAGHIYRTREGRRVKIYAIEDDFIHGAMSAESGKGWEKPDAWASNGQYVKGSKKPHPKDIVITGKMKFEQKKWYRMRNGNRALVVFQNPERPDYPIVGFAKESDGAMTPRVWNTDGITKKPFGPGNDLVAPWEDA